MTAWRVEFSDAHTSLVDTLATLESEHRRLVAHAALVSQLAALLASAPLAQSPGGLFSALLAPFGARWIRCALTRATSPASAARPLAPSPTSLSLSAGPVRGVADLRHPLSTARWTGTLEVRFSARAQLASQARAVLDARPWLVAVLDHLWALDHTRTPSTATPEQAVAAVAKPWKLTAHQRTVLTLVLQGGANKDIAVALDCSLSNAEARVRDLLRKARAPNRTALIAACFAAASLAPPAR